MKAHRQITNRIIAELLAREAEKASYHLARTFRRAARSAFLWPREAAKLIDDGESLTNLAGIGPFLEKRILAWIEKPARLRAPSIRRDFLTLAEARTLLSREPAWTKKLRGDLQMHTQWSDGAGTVTEMAEAGSARGYEYIAITDHSKGLKIAGGINEAALHKQGREIERADRKSTCRVLKSIEMNLNPRGDGDMDPAALAELDIVLGSFHSALRTKEDQTARYLAALRNPDIQILGHPRGRIYNFRLGLRADWQRVFAEAARRDKAVEIDSYPDRQDLNVALLKLAKREGARISLGTDAHHPWQLEFIDLGLASAFKAKIPAERIINFMPLAELRKWVSDLRAAAS
jgi:putative hydrolase